MSFPPGYPYSPPTFRFLTKMWHPNIYEVRSNLSWLKFFYTYFILVSFIERLMIYSRFCSPVMSVFQFYIPLSTIRKVVNYLPSDGTRHKMSGSIKQPYTLSLQKTWAFLCKRMYSLHIEITLNLIVIPSQIWAYIFGSKSSRLILVFFLIKRLNVSLRT